MKTYIILHQAFFLIASILSGSSYAADSEASQSAIKINPDTQYAEVSNTAVTNEKEQRLNTGKIVILLHKEEYKNDFMKKFEMKVIYDKGRLIVLHTDDLDSIISLRKKMVDSGLVQVLKIEDAGKKYKSR